MKKLKEKKKNPVFPIPWNRIEAKTKRIHRVVLKRLARFVLARFLYDTKGWRVHDDSSSMQRRRAETWFFVITRPSRIELKKELNEKNAINQLSPLTLAFLAATNRIVEQAKKNSKEKIRACIVDRARQSAREEKSKSVNLRVQRFVFGSRFERKWVTLLRNRNG